ncbi:MAG: alpha-2-macroglobulin family protein, partial [Gammaproteobacteria bacterium]|nr:alpha-2-macroglobulin family protein [Gammaproteobacteria bacterium]
MIRPHVRCLLLAALFALAAGGCGQPPDDQRTQGVGQPTDPTAAGDDAALAYVSYASDVSGDQPLLCLAFSAALDPAVDYSAYVGIDAQVALAVSGQRLCIGGLGFGESHALTLRAGLPAADGTRLAAEIRETLSFADRPAVVRFAGGGVILPRIEADGVGIETVNVDALRVTVSRVNDRALAFRAISAGYDAASGEYAWMPWNAQPEEVARQLWRGEMDTPGPANAAVTTVFPLLEVLGELAPGAYVLRAENLAEVAQAGERPIARAERWLIVTDLAFTAYRGGDGLDVVLRSLQSAAPARSVRVQLVARSNEILAEATSDREGRVRFAAALLRGEGPSAPRMLMAYGANGDFAVLDLDRAPVDLSDHPISGRDRGAVDAYLYLDRDIYRPGERVYASALIRTASGDALRDRPSTLVLTAPSGLEHERVRFDAAPRAGSVFHEFTLPRSAARGQWRLVLNVDGVGELASRRIAVEDFVPQRVELRLSADTDTPMAEGETRSVEAFARFLYGAPGAGLEVEGSVRVQPDPAPFAAHQGVAFGVHDEEFREGLFVLPRTLTDGTGTAVLALAPEARDEPSTLPQRLRTTVSVLEPGGRAVDSQIDIPYRPRAFYVGLQDEFADGRGEINAPVRYRVIAVDALGVEQTAELDWRLLRNDWTYDWYRSEGGEWRWRRSRRVVPIEEGRVAVAADGSTHIETRALDWGDYTLIVADGSESLASSGFWVGWGARPEDGIEAPDRVRVSAPASAPRVGERAELTILAPYAGVAEIVVATDRVLETRTIDVPEAGVQVSLPVTRDWGVGAYVMVSVFTPRDAQRQPRPRRAVGVAHIPVDVAADGGLFSLALDAPERMRPAQRLDIPVQATGVPARERPWVTLAAVDEGILQLTGFASPNPADWFFGKARLGVDLLDDYGRLLDPNQGRAAAVRSGGDSVGGEGLTVVPIRTVALFSGPVQLDAQGRGTLSIEVPDFNGELRLMAVAWSDTALASASRPLTVRDAVPAELVLPRFLAPGDAAQATLTLDNVEGEEGRYRSTVRATGAVELAPEPIELTLRAGQRAERAVGITAGAEGLADIELSVAGPAGFTAARSWPLEVRPAWLPERRVTRQRLQPGARLTPPSDALAGLAPDSATLQISFAATPIDVAAIYRALADYPYGCSEQLISRAFPLLYAGQLSALSEITPPAQAANTVREAIETLLSRQGGDGAFGLWRVGDGGASPWLGAYFTDF